MDLAEFTACAVHPRALQSQKSGHDKLTENAWHTAQISPRPLHNDLKMYFDG